jgi:hypothetical protein
MKAVKCHALTNRMAAGSDIRTEAGRIYPDCLLVFREVACKYLPAVILLCAVVHIDLISEAKMIPTAEASCSFGTTGDSMADIVTRSSRLANGYLNICSGNIAGTRSDCPQNNRVVVWINSSCPPASTLLAMRNYMHLRFDGKSTSDRESP